MTQADDPRQKEFDAIADEAIRLGYLNGMDFFVWGVYAFVSSEVVEMGPEGPDFVVWYRDRGQRQEIARARSVSGVHDEFFAELARLAAPRGRGPYAGKRPPGRYDGMTPEEVFELLKSQGYF